MAFSIRGALAFLAALPIVAAAQAVFPVRPITLAVPFAAAGGTDSIARDMAKNMADRLGQTVVIGNRGGAGGALGADLVAKAKPGGCTLLFATSTFVDALDRAVNASAAAEPVKGRHS